jgi:hypothetical protein
MTCYYLSLFYSSVYWFRDLVLVGLREGQPEVRRSGITMLICHSATALIVIGLVHLEVILDSSTQIDHLDGNFC